MSKIVNKIYNFLDPSGKYLFKLVHLKKLLLKPSSRYYSQSGEDKIIEEIFSKKEKGFYVDVGAFHPTHYSNTYLLYKKGWRGINIDPNIESIKLFNRYRANDLNIRIGISKDKEERDYYIFNHQSCNTFSEKVKIEVESRPYIKFIRKDKVLCLPLREILDRHLPNKTSIDLLNIDAEGLDMEVLISNDWSRFKPKVIVIEATDFDKNNPEENEAYSFLRQKGYSLHRTTGLSLIFINN